MSLLRRRSLAPRKRDLEHVEGERDEGVEPESADELHDLRLTETFERPIVELVPDPSRFEECASEVDDEQVVVRRRIGSLPRADRLDQLALDSGFSRQARQ